MIKNIIHSVYPISTQSLNKIEDALEFVSVQRGDDFIKKNSRNTKEYFLLEGVCRSYLMNHAGKEVTITFYTSQSVLSPHSARTKQGVSLYNFQALTDIRLAAIDAELFEKMRIDNLELKRFGYAVLQNELERKIDKEIGLASLSAKERLLRFRDQYPMLENLIPHKDIASYLGITNISLSRLRKSLTQ